MVEIVEASSGQIVLSTGDTVTSCEALKQLEEERPGESLFFLSAEGVVFHHSSDPLPCGRLFLLSKSAFAFAPPPPPPCATFDRSDLPTGDIYDQGLDWQGEPGNNGVGGWVVQTEKELFSLQEEAVEAYWQWLGASRSLRGMEEVLTNWKSVAEAIVRAGKRFAEDCGVAVQSLFHQFHLLPPQCVCDSFLSSLTVLASSPQPTTRSLALAFLTQRIDKSYSLLYMKTAAKLTAVQLSIADLIEKKLTSVSEQLEIAWEDTLLKLENGLAIIENEQQTEDGMRAAVRLYSDLRDALEANDTQMLDRNSIEMAKGEVRKRIEGISSESAVLKSAYEEAKLQSTRIRRCAKLAIGNSAYVTAKLKVQFVLKAKKIEKRLQILARIGTFFDIPEKIDEIVAEIETERQRRERFTAKSSELYQQMTDLVTEERSHRADFVSKFGSILPAEIFPAIDTDLIEFPEMWENRSVVDCAAAAVVRREMDRRKDMERDVTQLRRAVTQETMKSRLLGNDLRNLQRESRMLLATGLSNQREEIRLEVVRLKEEQEQELEELRKRTGV